MKKVFFIVTLFLSLAANAQCTGGLSVYMPPRVEASETKILEIFSVSEIPFFVSVSPVDTSIIYIFSGEVNNCSFFASAPAGKLEQVKKQITEKGVEVGIQYRKRTFHCYEGWKEYFK